MPSNPRPSQRIIAAAREEAGRGGSRHIHETLKAGAEIRLRGPSNLFRLDGAASHYVLVAGGIGITPILAMADRLKAEGKSYELHYAGRSKATMAFLDRSDHSTHCRWKGDASYYSIVTRSTTHENAAWSYEDPFEAVAEIKGHLAFYPSDAVTVEEI
jgi:uncharacterized protein (DUF427 family)